MFHVSRHDQMEYPPQLQEMGVSAFTGVELRLKIPLFMGEYYFLDEHGDPYGTRYLTVNAEKLAEPNIEYPNAKLLSVKLLTPPYINGTTEWKLDALAWFDEAEEPGGCHVELFGLKDGRVLWHNSDGIGLDALQNRQRVFEAPKLD